MTDTLDDDDSEFQTNFESFLQSPLLGKFVKIVGLKGRALKTISERDLDRKTLIIDGQVGQAFHYNEGDYLVHTFDGHTVRIPETNLEAYPMPSPEEGGCDLAYPVGGAVDGFSHNVAGWLLQKGFCMVQMSAGKQRRKEAVETVADACLPIEGVFKQELESAYLGTDNITEVKVIPEQATEDTESPLSSLQQDMFATFKGLEPYVEELFGHKCWATTSPWARVSEDQGEVDDSARLKEQDITGSNSNIIQAYERFVQGRKTCALYMVDNAGGEIILTPRLGSDLASAGAAPVKLPVSPNMMLIFRHDQMSYTYQPKGASLALQSWMLTDIPLARENMQIAPVTGVAAGPAGDNCQIMMADSILATGSVGADRAWSMWCAASDACIFWPFLRWDAEQYYTPEDDWAQQYKAYTCHGGFIEHHDMTHFDNKAFGIPDFECKVLAPGQRIVLSVGYSCLYKSGHTKETLRGENMGTYVGDVGMDWGTFQVPWSIWKHDEGHDCTSICEGVHNGTTAGRLSHILDMRGPVQTVDTACSSALIALQQGHKALMHSQTDTIKANAIGAPHSMIVAGVNTLLNPGSFVGNCMGNMLTHVGRCFTYNSTADGYQRGEGTGCVFAKWSGDRTDMEERMAVLTGSAAGADGRSASLTAPNGVAQQNLIKLSARMSGIAPGQIQICECHGTGTPLGDPIEVSALVATMQGRQVPAFITTQKTNLGHLEACAGMAAVIKSVMSIGFATAIPNLHLHNTNANIVLEGFPSAICSEVHDITFSTTYVGISSFGFGGANGRCDLYGRCLHGPRNTGNFWTHGRMEERRLSYAYGLRNSYKGYDKVDETIVPAHGIGIFGSWDEWEGVTMMDSEEPGVFTCRLSLGDMRQVSFGLLVEGNRDRQVFPAIDGAEASAVIAGPRPPVLKPLNTWCIDGRRDGMKAGTTYKVTFTWKGEKTLTWKPEIAHKTAQAAEYFIRGSWTAWVRNAMSCISQEDGLYECELEIGADGAAAFNLRRGKEISQTLYVNDNGFIEGPATPNKAAKDFRVYGAIGQTMKVQLVVNNADIDVRVLSEGAVQASWHNLREMRYYVTSSSNGWAYSRMFESTSLKGVYKCLTKVPDDEPVEYRIVAEGVSSHEFAQLSAVVPGGDAAVLDAIHDFKGKMGSDWEIVLDLNQDDPNRVIYHRPATHNERHKVYPN